MATNRYGAAPQPACPCQRSIPRATPHLGLTPETATGDIQVATVTAPGSYQVWYQLCDNTTSPASCALARAIINVRAAPSMQSVSTLGEMALLLLVALLGLGRNGRSYPFVSFFRFTKRDSSIKSI